MNLNIWGDFQICISVPLNKDLELINNWPFQWKMQFNADRKKQAQKLYFSKETGNQKSLDLTFDKNNVTSSPFVKHLSMLLDSRLKFNEQVQSKMNKFYNSNYQKIINISTKGSIT